MNIEYKSNRNTFYDSSVRSILQSIKITWEDVFHKDEPFDFKEVERAFLYDLARIPRRTHQEAKNFYKSKITTDCDTGKICYKSLEIWHCDSYGEPDRVIAIITE